MKVTPEQLARMLEHQQKSMPQILRDGAFVSAERSRAKFVKESPVDQGHFRAAWRAVKSSLGVTVENDAPHAGIIERGARPHKVSFEGQAAIKAWVLRKGLAVGEKRVRKGHLGPGQAATVTRGNVGFRDNEKAVDDIVNAIVRKIERYGQKGLFIVEKNLDNSAKWAGAEIERLIRRLLTEVPA